MNTDPVYERLREIGWKRALTPREQAELNAWLAAHPEAATQQAEEASLNALIARLPEAPVASNFAARVLQAIEREEGGFARAQRDRGWLWRVLVPRIAVAMAVVGTVGTLGYHEYRVAQIRGITNSITTVAGVSDLPGPEILADFDAIQKLDSGAGADKELLALMQ